ncbi:MFS transporter [Arthrobacter sp. E3]|uniref:CynX/NimT family MFS transporter n=1 Tax=Arthrobacter sp. E3 TaxID=517402 RepID=UPI001A9507ED|nr:MFS transporter [Arthrobacter sp. E3]
MSAGPRVRSTASMTPVMVALVFLVALNLRPALTAVGPLLPMIGAEENLGKGLQGLLGALPLLAFAAVSPLVHLVSRRLGMERTILVALGLLAAGTVIRSYTGSPGLWLGTIVVGSAIAIGNVLVPTLVKRDYVTRISRATSIYSACITISASIASAIAVPLATGTGWRGSLAFWAVPAVVTAVIWMPRTRGAAPGNDPMVTTAVPVGTVWRQSTAWFVTAYMGLQSTTFYIMVTWLPTIETANGNSPQQAGLHLFMYQIVGIVSGLTIPRMMHKPHSQVAAAVTASVPMIVGALGLMLFPAWGVAWAIIAGLGSGASLVVALTLISLRGRTHSETTQLSGMAQSVGYLFAAMGPVAAGYFAQLTGGWQASLALVAALAVLQGAAAFTAGRARKPHPATASR